MAKRGRDHNTGSNPVGATSPISQAVLPRGRARVAGKAVRKVLADRSRVIIDMRWDHVDSFITGNRAVTVSMVTDIGTDGEKINYRGCDLYEFRGDKILKKDT